MDATINSPVFPGDLILADQGRTELEFPDGSILWLDSGTRLELLGIRDDGEERVDNTVLRLHSGTLEMDYRGKSSDAGEDARIDTPESSIYFLGRGRFRVESDRDLTSLVSLRGVAELAGDSGSVLVRSGQKSQIWRGSVPEAPEAVNTLRLDDFDRWCEERTASYLSEDEGKTGNTSKRFPFRYGTTSRSWTITAIGSGWWILDGSGAPRFIRWAGGPI